MTEPVAAIPVATVVVAVIVTIVAMLVTVAVAMVSLRGGDDAADEREREGRSSEQTFHFDLPN
jgi:hypothetical protein